MSDEVGELLSQVEAARSLVLQSVADMAESQAAFKTAEESWSCTEVLEHLYLAEMSGIAKIWSAADDLRAGKGWTGDRPHRGKKIEQIIEETWKPKEKAPSIATPHIGGPMRFWRSALLSLIPCSQISERVCAGNLFRTSCSPTSSQDPWTLDRGWSFSATTWKGMSHRSSGSRAIPLSQGPVGQTPSGRLRTPFLCRRARTGGLTWPTVLST